MRQKPWYPVLYMFVITAFFSSILIGFARFTQDRVEANQRIAMEQAILRSLPLPLPDKISSPEIHQLFVQKIKEPSPDSGGAYLLMEEGRIAAYALPIEGQGFWDKIKGAVGIAADLKTLTGIAFYEQHETPGLGAEIIRPAFRSQFVAKRIAAGDRPVVFRPGGSLLGENEVHAVTGATQTSTRLETIINSDLKRWRAAMDASGELP